MDNLWDSTILFFFTFYWHWFLISTQIVLYRLTQSLKNYKKEKKIIKKKLHEFDSPIQANFWSCKTQLMSFPRQFIMMISARYDSKAFSSTLNGIVLLFSLLLFLVYKRNSLMWSVLVDMNFKTLIKLFGLKYSTFIYSTQSYAIIKL